ncbi:prenyltransferase/squalene oxidase repeat-containing protein [Novipirellula artificiosorum]|uniref:prenyltransferase/squalene oxidase repeat-containing protein n=1 Tax=Novipirellula artificiosorum TaxID=2528016 RepID=UPI001E507468|nr:prenyltransferase/squalene oxidase repeat-containing protein [Novipirellula artificiosorum]
MNLHTEATQTRIRQTLQQLRTELLAERTSDGHWTGQLSASALSTATAVSALSAVLLNNTDVRRDCSRIREVVTTGVAYLAAQQNADGGFGDTDRSYSNIATSYLARAAFELAARAMDSSEAIGCEERLSKLETYIQSNGQIDGLRRRYGTDKTFVVPILTNLAIAGLVQWKDVPALPFEAAVFPQSMYRLLRMPVVSYAIPALVAIGQARHFHGPRAFVPLRMIRSLSVSRTMQVLRRMQPDSGGYLEATPLTAFVLMSLAATDRGASVVARECERFLIDSMNADGSWPIDTNLATWVTSLAIHALAKDPEDDRSWCNESLVDWLLSCQHQSRHPFTAADPGGWGWTDLSGAVPDADDTPAAILALRSLRTCVDRQRQQAIEGAIDQARQWLIQLQNRDGGWPTFCRGWGKLPFDRSSTDLTAHALRAVGRDGLSEQAVAKAERFLARSMQDGGSWLPLWFGNQDNAGDENPVYGTAKVLLACAAGFLDESARLQGCHYLIGCQNDDGGWGGGPSRIDRRQTGMQGGKQGESEELRTASSVEETAVAVEALSAVWNATQVAGTKEFETSPLGGGKNASQAAIISGVDFLLRSVQDRHHEAAWPIGFYFAKLWYYEKLYPLIFTLAALGETLREEGRT